MNRPSLLEDMDKWDLEKFEAAAALGVHSGSVKELINLGLYGVGCPGIFLSLDRLAVW